MISADRKLCTQIFVSLILALLVSWLLIPFFTAILLHLFFPLIGKYIWISWILKFLAISISGLFLGFIIAIFSFGREFEMALVGIIIALTIQAVFFWRYNLLGKEIVNIIICDFIAEVFLFFISALSIAWFVKVKRRNHKVEVK